MFPTPFGRSRSSRSRRPLFILSVATGYGGAERNIEILVPRILRIRPVVVFAANQHHLDRLRALSHPQLEIRAVDAARETFVVDAARTFLWRYLARRPSAILANTLDSVRILSHAANILPGLDTHAFFYVHDFLWRNHEGLLAPLSRATLLVPERCILEKPGYIGRALQPEGPIRALVLPNPVEIPAAEPASPAAGAAFLHLATVNGFKGHRHLADAAALLRQHDPAIRILSCGHRPVPDLFQEVARHAEQVGATGTLTFRDHVPDPSDLLRSCRAVLVTSVSDHGGPETFGRTIIEGWSHGRPAIAFAAGGPARLIRHEVDGLLVDEGDAGGLAEAIARLHADPDLADRLGRAGRARAAAEFGTDVIVAQLLSILDGGWRPGPPAVGARGPEPSQGGPRKRVLLDVSLSLAVGWRAPIGLSRVERNVADFLARHPGADTRLVRSSRGPDGFRHLAAAELEMLSHLGGGLGALAGRELEASPPPRRPEPRITRYHAGLGALHLLARHHRASGDGGRLRRWLHRRAARKVAGPQARTGPGPTVAAGDTLICVANPWDNVRSKVFERLGARGAETVLVVHDLMVWEAPHWTAGRHPARYARNMLSTIALAKSLVCVSNATAAAVEAALGSIRRPVPPLVVAPPAGLAAMPGPVDRPPPGIDRRRPFVLYCSTIEVRKNHIMLLTLWDRLRQSLPAERLPLLVLVGRWGWYADAARLMLERNWRLAPHVRVLEELRDESLLWLYRNARFTVFPSFTEGFGLPVAESLSVGTPVVVSDHPALIEASEGLMPAIDPYDLPAWRREVASLSSDDERLGTLRRMARLYRGPRPDALARAVAAAAGLER